MKLGSKILIGFTILLVVLSVSATFYKTVVLQDFDVTGAYIEFPTEDSSYVWFVYNNEEYEIELESSNYEEILVAVSAEVGVSVSEMDDNFIEYIKDAFDAAEIVEVEIDTTETDMSTSKESVEATPTESESIDEDVADSM